MLGWVWTRPSVISGFLGAIWGGPNNYENLPYRGMNLGSGQSGRPRPAVKYLTIFILVKNLTNPVQLTSQVVRIDAEKTASRGLILNH